jgi:cystathionine beta-lyase/cystathionine gamma-synthase
MSNNTEKIYDVVFDDETSSNNKGFKETYSYCEKYIRTNNGTDTSYFKDYKNGTVSIINIETGDVIYSEIVK